MNHCTYSMEKKKYRYGSHPLLLKVGKEYKNMKVCFGGKLDIDYKIKDVELLKSLNI